MRVFEITQFSCGFVSLRTARSAQAGGAGLADAASRLGWGWCTACWRLEELAAVGAGGGERPAHPWRAHCPAGIMKGLDGDLALFDLRLYLLAWLRGGVVCLLWRVLRRERRMPGYVGFVVGGLGWLVLL